MSLQYRYEGTLIDMLSLLQQALFRCFTHQEIDLPKFAKYFTNFSSSMKKLQSQFHPNKIKMTKYLAKIDQLFQDSNNTKLKYATLQQDAVINQPAKKLIINYKHLEKSKLTLDNANVNTLKQQFYIKKQKQQEQLPQKSQKFQRTFQKRSQTAGQNRKKISLSIDYQNSRPMTGKIYSRQKNQRYRKYTMNSRGSENKITFSDKNSQNYLQTHEHENQIERKSLYDQLQSQKSYKNSQQFEFSNISEQYLQKSCRKKKGGFSRWSFKINKLL